MKKTYIFGGVALLLVGGGIAFYFYNKKKKSATSKSELTLNNPQGVAQMNLEEIDVNTKGYQKLSESLKKWKDFFKNYAKSGLQLRDLATGQLVSVEATESAYIFATKEIVSIEDGISKDTSISDSQKNLLQKMADAYFKDYLPLYFDKTRYNMYSTWYKDKVGQMKKIDYYN